MSRCKGLAQGSFGRAALLDIDRPIVGHAHPHCHVLVKIAGADSLFRVKGRDYPLTDCTAVAINSWEPHGYPRAPAEGSALILALYIRTAWLRAVEPSFTASGDPNFFRRPCFEMPAAMRCKVRDLTDALASPSPTHRETEALIGELMITMIDHFSSWRELRHTTVAGLRNISDFRIRRAIGFMQSQVGHPFTADDIARAAGLSRPHLFQLFRQHTGLTPNLYYGALRMESAFADLPASKPSIAEISSRLGFRAQSHFARFFRNNLGISPSEYRHLVRVQLAAGTEPNETPCNASGRLGM